MKPRQVSLLVSLDQCAVLSHIGKHFAEVCLAYNSKIYFPLRKSKEKSTWKCLRFASNHIGRTLAMCFVLNCCCFRPETALGHQTMFSCPVF